MDEFSYLSVLLSVILGLAVTQILKGFRGLLLSRARAWSSRTFLGKKLSIQDKIFTRTEAGSSRSAAARL